MRDGGLRQRGETETKKGGAVSVPISVSFCSVLLTPGFHPGYDCRRQTRNRAIKATGITGQYTSVMVHRVAVRKGNTLRPTNMATIGIGVFPSEVCKMRAQGKRSNARSWVFKCGVNNTRATTVALQRQAEP